MERKGREGKNLGSQVGKIKAFKDREEERDQFVGEGG